MCVHMFFFFNDTATTEIYTLSLHDALPILINAAVGAGTERSGQRAIAALRKSVAIRARVRRGGAEVFVDAEELVPGDVIQDRKSTRLNSSHANISYAVFCLKKKTHLTTDWA